MTQANRIDDRPLPRPAVDPMVGPADADFYDLVEARFRRLIRDNPVTGTWLGLHDADDRLGDGGREMVLAELEGEKAHLAAIEAIPVGGLSPAARFERELEVHNLRRAIFDIEDLRIWERRSFALDLVGDGLFLLFARDYAPLAERLDAVAGRLEDLPSFLEASKTRATVPQVRIWQQLEISTASELPLLLDEMVAAGDGVLGAAETRRISRAAEAAKVALELYGGWLEDSPGRRHRCLGDRSRAPRRARRPSGVRRPRCRRHPRARLGEARGRASGPHRRGAGGRSGPRRGRGDRRDQGRWSPRLRGRPRWLSDGDASRAPAPHRPRPRDGAIGRRPRGHPDAGIPAQRRAVRGVLLAARLRRGPHRHLRRHALGRR